MSSVDIYLKWKVTEENRETETVLPLGAYQRSVGATALDGLTSLDQ